MRTAPTDRALVEAITPKEWRRVGLDLACFGTAILGEVTNEVGPLAEGLTVAMLIEMNHRLMCSPPKPVEWATSDMRRVKRAIMADQTLVPVAEEDLKKVHSMEFYGMPIVYDDTLDPGILIEIRDQHGNCLGRIMAS